MTDSLQEIKMIEKKSTDLRKASIIPQLSPRELASKEMTTGAAPTADKSRGTPSQLQKDTPVALPDGLQPPKKKKRKVKRREPDPPLPPDNQGTRSAPIGAVVDAKSPATAVAAGPTSPAAVAPMSPPKRRRTTFQEDIVLHMLRTVRPFTLKTLAKELRTTDTAVHHVMLSLVDKGLVIKKEFVSKGGGRSRELYWADQDAGKSGSRGSKGVVSALHLMGATPEEMHTAMEKLSVLRRRHTAASAEMAGLTAEPTNAELMKQMEQTEGKVRDVVM